MGGIRNAVLGAQGKQQDMMLKAAGVVVEKKMAASLPPPPPDLTDEIVRQVQRAEADRLKLGRTRASTFVTANRSLLGG